MLTQRDAQDAVAHKEKDNVFAGGPPVPAGAREERTSRCPGVTCGEGEAKAGKGRVTPPEPGDLLTTEAGTGCSAPSGPLGMLSGGAQGSCGIRGAVSVRGDSSLLGTPNGRLETDLFSDFSDMRPDAVINESCLLAGKRLSARVWPGGPWAVCTAPPAVGSEP